MHIVLCLMLHTISSLQRSMSKEGEILREYTAKVQELQSTIDKQGQQLETLAFELEKVRKFNTSFNSLSLLLSTASCELICSFSSGDVNVVVIDMER